MIKKLESAKQIIFGMHKIESVTSLHVLNDHLSSAMFGKSKLSEYFYFYLYHKSVFYLDKFN